MSTEPRIVCEDSDCWYLERRPSTIKGAGDGVFARDYMPPGTLVAEYRGRIVDPVDSPEGLHAMGDKAYYISHDTYIVGESIAAYINDAVVLENEDGTPYTEDQWAEFREKGNLPTGARHYNCRFGTNYHKCLVWSTRAINKGDELFVPYGWGYWHSRLGKSGEKLSPNI